MRFPMFIDDSISRFLRTLSGAFSILGAPRRRGGDRAQQTSDVQDQGDLAVGQDCGSGRDVLLGEWAAERFDDRLNLAHEAVDLEPGANAAVLEHDDRLPLDRMPRRPEATR